ncbi:7214_t:CDS:1, partial [Paraglomus occultum]
IPVLKVNPSDDHWLNKDFRVNKRDAEIQVGSRCSETAQIFSSPMSDTILCICGEHARKRCTRLYAES